MLHGREAADAAAETARKTFEEGVVADSLPTVALPASEAIGMGVLSAFVRAGLVASTGEARRQIKGGGLRLNDVQEANGDRLLAESDVVDGVIKLSQGKKKIVLVRPV